MSEVFKVVEATAKVVPTEKAYDDLAHGTVSEPGKAPTDVVKVARLFAAPLQFIAAYQVRFERHCQRIADKVPEARRIEPSPAIAGPVLEALRFVDEQDLVTELMLNLLASASDTANVHHAHPAFAGIAVQLSSDEALILFHLRNAGTYLRFSSQSFRRIENSSKEELEELVINAETFPRTALTLPELFDVYMSHLGTLGLTFHRHDQPQVSPRSRHDFSSGTRYYREEAGLTEFGRMFVLACVPDELPAYQTSYLENDP